MMPKRLQLLPFRDALPVVIAAALLLGVIVAAARSGKPGPKINGPYKITFAGWVMGADTANVGGQKNVNIDADVHDAQGNKLRFRARLDMTDYRFVGTGTVDAVTVEIFGRIDPPDQTLTAARIVGTFVAPDGRAGRFVGFRKK